MGRRIGGDVRSATTEVELGQYTLAQSVTTAEGMGTWRGSVRRRVGGGKGMTKGGFKGYDKSGGVKGGLKGD